MISVKYTLKNKTEKPGFSYLVKTNTSNPGYYLFTDFERAMNQARVLSLTKFPLAIVYEPCQDRDGEWHLRMTYSYMSGKCYMEENTKMELHAKFYTEAGQWLNPEEPLTPPQTI